MLEAIGGLPRVCAQVEAVGGSVVTDAREEELARARSAYEARDADKALSEVALLAKAGPS